MKQTTSRKINELRRRLAGVALALGLLAGTSAFAQNANQILAVSPTHAAQGASLTVTFTLDTDVPPAPPAGVMPDSVSIVTLNGASISHSSQYTVTAVFSIPAGEPVGFKDAAVTFTTPNGTLTFSKVQGFEVTAGSGIAAGFTAAPTRGTAPLTVQFADASTGLITNRLWAFGDGATSASANPTHTYTNAGTYSVSLTVSGFDGTHTLTRTNLVQVNDPGAYAGTYVIVDTGQTQAYNNSSAIAAPGVGAPFYGQDASYAGNQPSYTLGGDGLTVQDNQTGLTWQRSPDRNGDGVIDANDKINWSSLPAYIAALNATNYGGFNDWRLPTIKELYSLVDFRGTDPSGYSGTDTSGFRPYIDTNYFAFGYGDTSAGERIIDAQYWSSTEYVSATMGGNATVFGFNFADGRIKGYPRDTGPGGSPFTEYLRCVRGNPDYGINSFADNGNGTVTDLATGLMWAQADSGTGLNWSNALAWVEAKNAAQYLGFADWRLPDAKELQSLIDYTRSPDTTASAAIDPLFQTTSIVNEAGQTDYPAFWTGTTHANWTGTGDWGVYVCFGRAMGYFNSAWMDVHGAGAQRSDPKSGSAADYPTGHGPQGDAVRVTNFVRLVRTVLSGDDSVGDGIPDTWRKQYFGGTGTTTNALSCAGCDADGDGVINSAEYVADTNPTNAASFFQVQSLVHSNGITLSFPSSTGRQYTLYSTSQLEAGGWTNLPSQSQIPGTGGILSLTDPAPVGERQFYRVGVDLP